MDNNLGHQLVARRCLSVPFLCTYDRNTTFSLGYFPGGGGTSIARFTMPQSFTTHSFRDYSTRNPR